MARTKSRFFKGTRKKIMKQFKSGKCNRIIKLQGHNEAEMSASSMDAVEETLTVLKSFK